MTREDVQAARATPGRVALDDGKQYVLAKHHATLCRALDMAVEALEKYREAYPHSCRVATGRADQTERRVGTGETRRHRHQGGCVMNRPKECWAAIDENGKVVGLASMEHYTFFEAAKEFKPLEVRRMGTDEAIAAHQSMFATEEDTGGEG